MLFLLALNSQQSVFTSFRNRVSYDLRWIFSTSFRAWFLMFLLYNELSNDLILDYFKSSFTSGCSNSIFLTFHPWLAKRMAHFQQQRRSLPSSLDTRYVAGFKSWIVLEQCLGQSDTCFRCTVSRSVFITGTILSIPTFSRGCSWIRCTTYEGYCLTVCLILDVLIWGPGCAWEFRNELVLMLLPLLDRMGDGLFLFGVPCLLVLQLSGLLPLDLRGDLWQMAAGSLTPSLNISVQRRDQSIETWLEGGL